MRQQDHTGLPLAILNYTQQAQFTRAWDPVTRACRGLIYNTETGDVVARPFPKFFNFGEHEAPVGFDTDTYEKVYTDPVWHRRLLDSPCTVTDKMDGSLGILYPCAPARHAIATRGSFVSDQAMHATRIYAEKYAGMWIPDPALTYLFEIIYPSNRIVLDYGEMDDLILIGIIGNEDGKAYPLNHRSLTRWPGGMAEALPATTLREALALPARPNKEGVVVRFRDVTPGAKDPAHLSSDNGLMLKIKQEDYVALHRLIFGLSQKRVWEALSQGARVDDICAPLPEEFHGWIEDTAFALLDQFMAVKREAQRALAEIVTQVSCEGHRDWSRAEFAERAKQHATPGLLFSLLDQKSIDASVWRMVKPTGAHNPFERSEDVA